MFFQVLFRADRGGLEGAESWVIVPFVRVRICLVFGDLCNGYFKEKDLLLFVGELSGLIDFLYEDCSFDGVAGCLATK